MCLLSSFFHGSRTKWRTRCIQGTIWAKDYRGT
jgi:hypothetical protein